MELVGGQRIHRPAAKRASVQRHDARIVHAVRLIEFCGEALRRRKQRPQMIQKRLALRQMVGGQVSSIGKLCVQIVVIIALPWRQSALIRSPDALKRHRRMPWARTRAQKNTCRGTRAAPARRPEA